MLHCYLDDSGSDDSSPAVVWGGVVGSVEQFETLEREWRALLQDPLPGKPRLRKFSLYACRNRVGEFKDYNFAEKDHVQYIFRKAIIRSGVMPIACGVDCRAWNSSMTGSLRARLGGAERLAFGNCLKAALEIAESDGLGMHVVLDRGAMNRNLLPMQEGALSMFPPEVSHTTSINWEQVAASPGLQAADLSANYFLRYAKKWLLDKSAKPEPHFDHLVQGVEQKYFIIHGKSEIVELARKVRLDSGL